MSVTMTGTEMTPQGMSNRLPILDAAPAKRGKARLQMSCRYWLPESFP